MNRIFSCTLLFFFIVFIQCSIHAQGRLYVTGVVADENGKLPDADIIVETDTIYKFKSDDNGRFSLYLDFNSYYFMSFRKSGYGTKKISINTRLPEEENKMKHHLITMNLELIKQANENPSDVLGEVRYNRVTKEFTYESKYDKNSFLNIRVAGVDYYDNLIEDSKEGEKEEVLVADANIITKKKNDIIQRKKRTYKRIEEKRNELLDGETTGHDFEDLEIAERGNQELVTDTVINQYSHHRMDLVEIIISSDKFVRVYHRVKHYWGAVFYFRNYRSITQTLFKLETNFEQKKIERDLTDKL